MDRIQHETCFKRSDLKKLFVNKIWYFSWEKMTPVVLYIQRWLCNLQNIQMKYSVWLQQLVPNCLLTANINMHVYSLNKFLYFQVIRFGFYNQPHVVSIQNIYSREWVKIICSFNLKFLQQIQCFYSFLHLFTR